MGEGIGSNPLRSIGWHGWEGGLRFRLPHVMPHILVRGRMQLSQHRSRRTRPRWQGGRSLSTGIDPKATTPASPEHLKKQLGKSSLALLGF